MRTLGAHGAYTHLTPSATKIAARMIVDLEDLTTLPADVPIDVADALAGAAAAIDEAQGPGAKDIVQRVTVNIGVIHGGQKVEHGPRHVLVRGGHSPAARRRQGRGDGAGAGDRRALPGGHDGGDQLLGAQRVRSEPRDGGHPPRQRPGAGPARARPDRAASEAPTRGSGASAASPGSCTARSPAAWPEADEHVEIEEYLHIVRMHVLSAFDYLSG